MLHRSLAVKLLTITYYRWIVFANNVSKTVGISSTSHTKFLVGGFAGSSHSTTGFSPQAIYAAGILNSAPGAFITR